MRCCISTPASRHRCAGGGFTIVEMMVVVAIVALLIGLFVPAISGARKTARQVTELAAARQLMVGYVAYTNANDDRVMPGYKSGLQVRDKAGRWLKDLAIPTVVARYPWRIAPYLNYDFRGLYLNEHGSVLEDLETTSYDDYVYFVSLSPSLGLNSTWLGGDETRLAFDPIGLRAYGKFYVTALPEVRHTDRLLVFSSARGVDPLNVGASVVEGYFKVTSPRFSASGGYLWSESFAHAETPADFGFVSARHNHEAAAAFADGHVGTLTEDKLSDMRHWANKADAPDWGLTPVQP